MTLRIGQVAERAGVSVRALRYYEEQGLLHVERSPSGQRLYRDEHVARVRLYQEFFAAGLSSANIAQLLPCLERGHTDAEQRAMLRAQRAQLVERRDALTAALDRLDGMIDITSDHP